MSKIFRIISNKFPSKDITKEDLKNKLILVSKKKKIEIKLNSKFLLKKNNLAIIAGPNGVENIDMMFKTVNFLVKQKINFIRGHVFKPLTFPYRSKIYSESGFKGLDWMDEIKRYYKNISFVTEVTEIKYLERILLTSDILQIGSRNMQNFELIKEVAQSKKTIILKRHFGSSLRDFLAAAEYILVENNSNLILCERGVVAPHTHRVTSRFMLDIQGIVALKELTNYPVISDPSHASFWAPWVEKLALASVASGCDGLIIEVHPNPRLSKVDPLQALNFNEFKKLKNKILGLCKLLQKKVI